MNIILIFFKIVATIAVIFLAKETELIPFHLTTESEEPEWRRIYYHKKLLALLAIIMIWL